MVRYYSTQRPVMPGSFPNTEAVEKIENFDSRTFCEEVGREAWGYIDYSASLSEKEARDYELVKLEKNGTDERRKKTMKWEVKHDIAKKVIDHFLDNAGYWQESEMLAGGLDEEDKKNVNDEIELMIASIRKRYKLQERLPQSEENTVMTKEVIEEQKTDAEPGPVETEEKPKRVRRTTSADKKPAARKPRTKKVKEEAV